MEYPLFDFKDFSDFSDFDFFDDDNDIMVNETATSFSRVIKEIIHLCYTSNSLII